MLLNSKYHTYTQILQVYDLRHMICQKKKEGIKVRTVLECFWVAERLRDAVAVETLAEVLFDGVPKERRKRGGIGMMSGQGVGRGEGSPYGTDSLVHLPYCWRNFIGWPCYTTDSHKK